MDGSVSEGRDPLSHLSPFVSARWIRKARYQPSYGGRSSTEVSRKSGLHEQTILNLLNLSDDSRRIDPETLWIISRPFLPSMALVYSDAFTAPNPPILSPNSGRQALRLVSPSQIRRGLDAECGGTNLCPEDETNPTLDKLKVARRLEDHPGVGGSL